MSNHNKQVMMASITAIPSFQAVIYTDSDGSIHCKRAFKNEIVAPSNSAYKNSKICSVSRRKDHMEIFWISPNGSIKGAYWYSTINCWEQYQLVPDNSASLQSGIYAISQSEKFLNVFWIGLNGSVESCQCIEYNYRTKTIGWKRSKVAPNNSAALSSNIVAAVNDVWWQSPNQVLEGACFNKGVWNRYNLGTVAIGSGITALYKKDKFIDVWWIHPNGSIQGSNYQQEWKRYELAHAHSASLTGGLISVLQKGNVKQVWWITPTGEINYKCLEKNKITGQVVRVKKQYALINSQLSGDLWYTSHDGFLKSFDKNKHCSKDNISLNIIKCVPNENVHIVFCVATTDKFKSVVYKHCKSNEFGYAYPDLEIFYVPKNSVDIIIMSYIIVVSSQDSNLIKNTVKNKVNLIVDTGLDVVKQTNVNHYVNSIEQTIQKLLNAPTMIDGEIPSNIMHTLLSPISGTIMAAAHIIPNALYSEYEQEGIRLDKHDKPYNVEWSIN